MVERKIIFDFEDITRLFGVRSELFKELMSYLEKEIISKNEDYEEYFKKWKAAFKNIYGDDVDQILFLRHTYFAFILKAIISIKLNIIHNLDLEDSYEDFCSNNLKSLRLFELEYFNWTSVSKKIFEKIYDIIETGNFARQDLFHDVYQQLIFSITRHKIGEFYTPNKLVNKMIEDSYEIGLKVLDPCCGSGSFLINIIIRIMNSEKEDSLKIESINHIYGIDINPLATLTSKINISLLLFDYFDFETTTLPIINVFLFDSLFPEKFESELAFNLKELYSSFDLIIGNPPWLTYKELTSKEYQLEIRELSERLNIKPSSQYITHIELAAVFFYAIPLKFLKLGGKVFFVTTKSVLNGDHCNKFRAFSMFLNLEIWDFPNYYFFRVDHICLKGEYIGKKENASISDRYPIKTKLFNDDLVLQQELYYSTLKIEDDGARLILPEHEINALKKVSYSPYKNKFHQGATLVPGTLTFFQIEKKEEDILIISSDQDVVLKAKENWKYKFHDKEIEKKFRYKTFLNRDLIPFYLKFLKNVFLPVNESLTYDEKYLEKSPKALKFYKEMNEIYQKKKKKTSDIETLFSNLNYYNKLSKQFGTKNYLVVYNASGSSIKAAVINNRKKKIIVGSENYYFSTDSESEAYYISAVLNSPNFSKYIKLIKSSRHIHKRPFLFPIPLYDSQDVYHNVLAKKGKKCQLIVKDLVKHNPKINSDKLRIIINQKLKKLEQLTEQVVFQSKS